MTYASHASIPDCSVFEYVDKLRLPLVNRFYAKCNYTVKCGRQDRVFSLSQQGEIIAAARLMPNPKGHFLLRNLCVAPEMRNQGLATYLITKILIELAPLSSLVYCYALPHLQNFYLALGFKLLTTDQVPHDIAEIHLRNCERKRGWILMGYCNNVGSNLSNSDHKQN
jgi:predicted GNAT family N-acyltransferase